MIIYPDKPWADGQQFSPSPGVTATFSTSKNAWSFVRSGGNVSTQDVLTVNFRPPDASIAAARRLFAAPRCRPKPHQHARRRGDCKGAGAVCLPLV